MLSDKPIVRNLVEVCAAKGIQHVILSPGSRNAPLTISFNEHGAFQCLSIPDERVAGYFALGIAQQTRQPVIINCTSGTAALNFAPAIAEAFYQKIPLLIITADRPVEWIHQGEGQSINQQAVFANYIKKSYQLPQESSDKDSLWSIDRMVAEAIHLCQEKGGGPVHLNIPFHEPLYGQKDYVDIPSPRIIESVPLQKELAEATLKTLEKMWIKADKKMILCGLLPYQKRLSNFIQQLSKDPSVIVLSETTSNIIDDQFVSQIDGVLTTITKDEIVDFRPDLLLTVGGSFISKKIKQFLRANQPPTHWHIGEEGYFLDTFQSLTQYIEAMPITFFQQFLPKVKISPSDEEQNNGYQHLWRTRQTIIHKKHQQFLATIKWSDLKAFEILLDSLPKNCNLQMGNSTPVRYVQFFSPNAGIHYNANRGVAGIDGCTSTAAGAALVNNQLTVLVTGDIAFFYDSNAFWHHHLSPNLRVIIFNNEGGNIFRFIPGPDTTNQLTTFFETKHQLRAAHIAKTFDIVYYLASEENKLQQILSTFFLQQVNNRPAILEIKTNGEESANILRAYFKHLVTL